MKNAVRQILIGLFAAIFVFSAYSLITYFMEIRQSESEYEALAEMVQQQLEETVPEETDASGQFVPRPSKLVEVTDPDTGETLRILQEYAPVYRLNSDLVGWIKIHDSNIDFPVLQNTEYTDYYLKRNFYGQWSNQGAIYVREQCDVNTPSDNITIYGHRTNAGTMFAHLQKYKKEEFWQTHSKIRFDTLSSHYTYEIFSVFLIDATAESGFAYHEFVDAADKSEFDRFVSQCKDRSLYDTGITPQYGDKLITLSTCHGDSTVGRLVVVARRSPNQ